MEVVALAGAQAEGRVQQAVGDDLGVLVVHQQEAAALVVEHRYVGLDAGTQAADLVRHAEHVGAMGGHHRHDLFQAEAERQHAGHRRGQREVVVAGEHMHLFLVGMRLRRAARLGNRRVVAMHVGAQRVRHDAGLEHQPRDLEREVRAVADVGLEATRQRLAHHRMQLAATIDEAAGMAREGMGEDVARPQDVEHLRQDGVGVVGLLVLRQRPELAEVDVERQVERAGDLRRAAHGLVAPARETADLGMALHAAHEVGILAAGAHRVVDGDAVGTIEFGIVVAFEAAHHVGRDEGQHAGRRGFHREFAEAREGQHRRTALVDHGGDAGMHAHHVGIEAEAAADVAIDMGVGVDQAGQHQLAAHVGRFAGRSRQILADVGDAAAAHGDIHDAVEALGRIDDAAASQDEIVGCGLHDSLLALAAI